MSESTRITAVLVAWNAGESLSRCVTAVRDSAHDAGEAVRFVVVDNDSTDDAVATCPLDDLDLVVRNPVNGGYGVAAAQGIALTKTPWVLLLNADVSVEQGFVGALLDAVDRAASDVATLVPELRFADRPDIVNCRGLSVDEIGVPAEIDAGEAVLAGERSAPSRPPLGGSSGCCLLRMDALARLGGPEASFFAYLEDVDLALRLARAGYRAEFVPTARALHVGSVSTGSRSPLKTFLVARNRRSLFRLHGPWSVRARAWRSLVDLSHAAYSSLSTPVAPWSGRFHALQQRRHTGFLRRARAAHEPSSGSPKLAPRVGLRDTLRRKRNVLHD